jgi:hypothetical protein
LEPSADQLEKRDIEDEARAIPRNSTTQGGATVYDLGYGTSYEGEARKVEILS